jgi:hypothetical protein
MELADELIACRASPGGHKAPAPTPVRCLDLEIEAGLEGYPVDIFPGSQRDLVWLPCKNSLSRQFSTG